MIRCISEVLPAPDGWCEGCGDISSRIAGDEFGMRASSAGIPKTALLALVSVGLLVVESVQCSSARSRPGE